MFILAMMGISSPEMVPAVSNRKRLKKQIRFFFYFDNNHSWLVVITVFNNQFSANMTNAFISKKFITVHEKR